MCRFLLFFFVKTFEDISVQCTYMSFMISLLCILNIITVVVTINDTVVTHCYGYYYTTAIVATNIQTGIIVDGFLKLVISHAQSFNDRTKRDLSFKFKHLLRELF